MKTADLNKHAFAYILNCIDSSDYDLESEPQTDADKLAFLSETFHAEYGWMVQRVGPITAFAEWCKGLPSSFNCEFRNHAIIDLAKEWGSIPADATERQEQKILDNWFNLIANKTFQLFKKYEIA